MWLQLRLSLLVGLIFGILFEIIVGIAYFLGYSGFTFYLLIIGFALALVLIQYAIGPKIVEWSMKIKYVNENEYPKLHRMVAELAEKAGLPKNQKLEFLSFRFPMRLHLEEPRGTQESA